MTMPAPALFGLGVLARAVDGKVHLESAGKEGRHVGVVDAIDILDAAKLAGLDKVA